MTTIDYKEKYEQALERARQFFEKPYLEDSAGIVGYIFPELKESEDERIRKEIIELVMQPTWKTEKEFNRRNELCEWLEKQGEQKPALKWNELTWEDINTLEDIINRVHYEYPNGIGEKSFCKEVLEYFREHKRDEYLDAKEGGQKPNDKVEPKFHEGQWITNGDYTWKIVEIKPLDYILQSQDGNIVDDTIFREVEHFYHLWTIQDAKDGDVLCYKSGWTCIFKTLVNDEAFSSYCFMDKTKWFCEKGSECHTLNKEFTKAYNGEIKPATKEQRDLLFQKMHEAGYEWDVEKKELKKIEQKHAWSEKDEEMYKKVETAIDSYYAPFSRDAEEMSEWLKDLKDRVLPQPKQEWSEEDENKLKIAIENCYECGNNYVAEWLKSLRPQKQWKPSEEQMNNK